MEIWMMSSLGAARVDWLIFAALGFMWGSSYLFIKIAVDDFGTFTLVALRLAVGSALLWAVTRIAGQAIPRTRRIYGHLFVMAMINIAVPFLLITWAERSVDSALAAISTALVPLFVVVLTPLFVDDEPLHLKGIVGLALGLVGVIVLTGRDLTGMGSDAVAVLALLGSSLSYAAGAVYARRHVRAVPPMIPAVFQVTFAMIVTGTVALVFERPWEARPDLAAILSIAWLGLLGSGVAYLAFFRLLSRWGATRTVAVAYILPVVGIVLGFLVLREPIDARVVVGTALIIGGVALVNSRVGRRAVSGGVRAEAPIRRPVG